MILMDLNEQADKDFGRVRLKARVWRVVARLCAGTVPRRAAPSFDEVRRSLRAYNRVPRGVRIVDAKVIVGSVGRRGDFDSRFMPLRASVGERWKRLDIAFHRGKGLPRVRLYKVGDAYFVLDGNHRVSVTRYHGVPALEAELTEFLTAHAEGADPDGEPWPEARVA